MKVQVKVTEIPPHHAAYVRCEDPDTGNAVGEPLAVTNEQVNEVEVPEGMDVRVFSIEDKAHTATKDYMRTGAVDA